MRHINSLIILLFFITILTGCQKFIEIKAEIQNDTLLFVFSNRPANAIIKIYDIELYKINCQNNCVMWHMVNKINTSSEVTYIELKGNYIEYGQRFSGMNLKVPPKALIPGKYTATGTASIKNEGGRLFVINFELELDKNGKLTVKNQLEH